MLLAVLPIEFKLFCKNNVCPNKKQVGRSNQVKAVEMPVKPNKVPVKVTRVTGGAQKVTGGARDVKSAITQKSPGTSRDYRAAARAGRYQVRTQRDIAAAEIELERRDRETAVMRMCERAAQSRAERQKCETAVNVRIENVSEDCSPMEAVRGDCGPLSSSVGSPVKGEKCKGDRELPPWMVTPPGVRTERPRDPGEDGAGGSRGYSPHCPLPSPAFSPQSSSTATKTPKQSTMAQGGKGKSLGQPSPRVYSRNLEPGSPSVREKSQLEWAVGGDVRQYNATSVDVKTSVLVKTLFRNTDIRTRRGKIDDNKQMTNDRVTTGRKKMHVPKCHVMESSECHEMGVTGAAADDCGALPGFREAAGVTSGKFPDGDRKSESGNQPIQETGRINAAAAVSRKQELLQLQQQLSSPAAGGQGDTWGRGDEPRPAVVHAKPQD